MSTNSFSLEHCQKIGEIQSKKDEKIIIIEDADTNLKYIQKIENRTFDSEKTQDLYINNMEKLVKVTKYPGLMPIISFKTQPNPTIILEYKENGTLRDFIASDETQNKTCQYLTDTKKYINILGIAYAIQYLHCHNIFVKNIDSSDIFLDENLYPHLCITQMMNDRTDYFITWPRDIFSFSIIAYEIITGTEQSISIDEISETRPDLTKISSEWQKQFLQKCWSKYETQRPNIFDIIQELESNKAEFGNIEETELKDYQNIKQQFLEKYSKDVKKYSMKKDRDFCFVYGNMLTNGYGISTSKREAAHYYKISADLGHVSSIFNYAFILDNIEGIFSRKKEAIKYYKLACEHGHSTSMFNYAFNLYNGEGIPVNKEEAASYFKFSADLGNSNSMFNIALMLEKGEGIPVNKEEAAKYYKKSADRGNIIAMNSFASLLKKGIGIKRNKKEAAFYFKTAADFGNSSAMFNYAFMLKIGNGIQMNKEEAFKYFKLATDQGNISAAFNLALMLYNGEGVLTDKNEASRYFKMAADDGNVDAMFDYALMLKNGDGIQMDRKEAAHYFKMAANKGNEKAMKQYRNITQFIRASI